MTNVATCGQQALVPQLFTIAGWKGEGQPPLYTAALVEAQQPAPSAAAAGEVPLPLLVRDIAADLGTTPIQVCTALAQLGFGGHSVNMAVTPRMAQSLRAHFASPTPQADSQPAPVRDYPPLPRPDACDGASGTIGWSEAAMRAYVDADRAARAPADSVLEDAAFEAVRKKLCALPRYSFVLDDDGLIRRVQDRTGNWIEFDAAHELFDPVAVDAARKQGGE